MTTYAVTSEVLEPGAVLHVLVVAADLGEWAPESETILRRTVTVTVQLVEVLLGRVAGDAALLTRLARVLPDRPGAGPSASSAPGPTHPSTWGPPSSRSATPRPAPSSRR